MSLRGATERSDVAIPLPTDPTNNNFFLPSLSERKPIGKLRRIPASGERAAINPIIASFAPRAFENRERTGFLDIVVENIAKNPITDR